MAAWQFDLDFVRACGRQDIAGPAASLLLSELERRVGKSNRILAGWDYIGSKDGNRVDVFVDEDGTLEAQARVDTRASEIDCFVDQVCAVAETAGCRLFSSELGVTFDPNPSQIKLAVQKSEAWLYALLQE